MKTATQVSTKVKVLIGVGIVAGLAGAFAIINSLGQSNGLVPSLLRRTAVQTGPVIKTMPKPNTPIKLNGTLPKSNTPINAPIRK
jgi:hypothetical protein